MNDFLDMARKARQKYDAEQNEKARLYQEKADMEAARLADAKKAIHDDVLPTLEQAKQAFAQEGITGVIEEHESFSNDTHQKVWAASFKCCKKGDANTSRAGIATCGTRVKFQHDGSRLSITKEAARQSVAGIATIKDAIAFALETYFAAEKQAN